MSSHGSFLFFIWPDSIGHVELSRKLVLSMIKCQADSGPTNAQKRSQIFLSCSTTWSLS